MTVKILRLILVAALLTMIYSTSLKAQDETHLPVSGPIDSDSAGRGGDVASKSVLRIFCFETNLSGTAFLHKSGNLITAAHVVIGCKTPILMLPNNDQIKSTIFAMDVIKDLALIQPSTPIQAVAPPISSAAILQTGAQVSTWGFPSGYSGRAPLLGVGYLAGLDAVRTSSGEIVTQWVVNAAFNSGNSGGPLIQTETGQVIGVVSSKLAPISKESMGFLNILKNTHIGLVYPFKNIDGTVTQVSEGQMAGAVLDELRKEVQLVIGYATLTGDLRAFLITNGLDP